MSLTPQQEAILSASGVSVAVTAGAGCGKTFVLTERYLAYLRERVGRADPLSGIVAITFTNKAAREMRQRVRAACAEELQRATGDEVAYWIAVMRELDGAQISTIHSFAAGLLRRFAVESGIDPGFAIPEGENRAPLIEAAYCDLLEEGHAEARELVVRFGAEATVAMMEGLCPGLRQEGESLRLKGMSPARVCDYWRELWEERLGPEKFETFCRSPELATTLELLRENEPRNAKMRERRTRLLELLPNPPSTDRSGWFAEIAANSTLQHGGAARGWKADAPYALIRAGLSVLREESRTLAEQFQTAELSDEDAAAVTLAAQRVACDLINRMEARKAEGGIVEFDDLLLRTRDLLTRRPDVVQRASAGLELLMVDEFQDTDSIQAEIVRRLCGEQLAGGLLFLVGDAKQSIYRFRGADPAVFAQLRRVLPKRGHLPLSINFRSQPAILDFVNHVFKDDVPDYEPLSAHCDQISPEPTVEFLLEQAEKKEKAEEYRARSARSVASRLRRLFDELGSIVRDEESGQLRRCRPGDVAVLFRTLSNVQAFEEALQGEDIPYYLVNSRSFYMQQEVHDLAHLCRWLADPADELSLVGVLRSPMFGLTDDTIFALKPDKRRSLSEGFADPPALEEPRAEQLQRVWEILQELRAARDACSLAELLELAIEKTAYDAALLAEPLGTRKVANLRKFVEMGRVVSSSGSGSLFDFAARLEEAVREEAKEEVAATQFEVGDVVRLMTIHQSKGLEFPVVVLAEMDWKPKSDSADARYHSQIGPVIRVPRLAGATEDDGQEGPPPAKHLGQLLYEEFETAEAEAERTRMLYVALTRARDRLILAGTRSSGETESSPWLRLLGRRYCLDTGAPLGDGVAADGAPLPAARIPEEAAKREGKPRRRRGFLSDFEVMIARGAPEPLPELMEAFELDPADRRIFTATKLTEIDHQQHAGASWPEPDGEKPAEALAAGVGEEAEIGRNEAKSVGTLVHGALELVDFQTIEPSDQAELDRLIAQALQAASAPEAKQLAESVREKVLSVLQSPFRAELAGAKRLARELPFQLRWPTSEGEVAQIVGVIDGLYQDSSGTWRLFDYKVTEQSRKSDKALIERYGLQMLLYAIAIERALGVRPASAELIRLDRGIGRISVSLDGSLGNTAPDRIDRAIAVARSEE